MNAPATFMRCSPKATHSPLMISARALASRFICAITWETNVGVKRDDEALVAQLLAAVRKAESDKRELVEALETIELWMSGYGDKTMPQLRDLARSALKKAVQS